MHEQIKTVALMKKYAVVISLMAISFCVALGVCSTLLAPEVSMEKLLMASGLIAVGVAIVVYVALICCGRNDLFTQPADKEITIPEGRRVVSVIEGIGPLRLAIEIFALVFFTRSCFPDAGDLTSNVLLASRVADCILLLLIISDFLGRWYDRRRQKN